MKILKYAGACVISIIAFACIIYGFILLFASIFISKNIIFNIIWGFFVVIGLDLKIIWKDKEIFRLCWGLQWLIKEILPKYKNKE